ncbi:hypothetical protein PZN02_004690 [Sinorhizobium garamanticum]|uniref:Uncharacterized protein n=1 Tax=Sinorhizobium garamanticum TaxID=680247 RepID=A0ABY8DJK0_9HYPH|nr:hypothetical protein [Sinorhizobium garamanticum]WEX91079.1 hypothetical protein PZN02_004690 [Sinorhizobium garamanticum]
MSLADFLTSPVPDGVSFIPYGEANLYLRVKRKTETHRLVVIFSAAATRAPDRRAPFFHGVKISDVLNSNVLLIDDIAHQFGEDVSIGWHVGTRDINTQQIMPQIINHVASQLDATDIVLAGGSAGGFAALYYGSVIPSTVMVVNPQTDVLRYYIRHVQTYLSSCFGWSEGEDMRSPLGDRIVSLPPHLAINPLRRAVYFQNNDDTHHLERHAYPLLKALGGWGGPRDASHHGIDFYFRRWGEGHAPMPPAVFADCLNHILSHGVEGVSEAMSKSLGAQPA